MNVPARYPSKERVVRDDVLIYAEGFPIDPSDVAELERQGYTDAAKVAPAGVPMGDAIVVPPDGTVAELGEPAPKKAPAKKAAAKRRTRG